MPEQQRQRAKGRKIGRNTKHQATIYAATDRWNKNRKRAMRRHLRSNPHDVLAIELFRKRYGATENIGLSGKGRRLLKSNLTTVSK